MEVGQPLSPTRILKRSLLAAVLLGSCSTAEEQSDLSTAAERDTVVTAAVDETTALPATTEATTGTTPGTTQGSAPHESSPAATAEGPSFEEVQVELPSRFLQISADPATLFWPITIGDRNAGDPCTDVFFGNLPSLDDYVIPLRSVPSPAESTGGDTVERTIPNGVRVVYHGEMSDRQETFDLIAEAMTRCVGDMPFREQDRDGAIRVEPLDVGLLGDDRVAVRVSDVGPNSGSAGWTADYYWIGFALDDAHLVGVALNEAWRGFGSEDWPEEYPQPTITEGAFINQLEEALAFGW